MFAGFPYKSRNAPARLNKISRVVIWWTLGRVVWGIVVLTTILQGWLTHAHRDRQIYSLVLVGLFLVTELIPYVAALDQDLLALIATDARAAAAAAAGGGAGSGVTGSRYGTLQAGLTPASDDNQSPLVAGEYGPPDSVSLGRKAGAGSGDGDDEEEEDEDEDEEGRALYDAVGVAGLEEEGKVAARA